MATVTSLLTAKAFLELPDQGVPMELVRGEVRPMNLPSARHGRVAFRAAFLIETFAEPRQLGFVITNDSGVITERNPDTVRGPDVAYYSSARVSKDNLPLAYLEIVPDVVVEVLSPSDRWSELLRKVSEYLAAGVKTVVVLDPEEFVAHVYLPDKAATTHTRDQELTLTAIAADCRIPVQRFFE